MIKIQMWYFYTISIKNKQSKIDGVVMGVYSGWDYLLQNYGVEFFFFFFYRRRIFYMISIIYCSSGGIQSEVVCSYMCL